MDKFNRAMREHSKTKEVITSRNILGNDPVQCARLRFLIERIVAAGLPTPRSSASPLRNQRLPLAHPYRGSATTAFTRQMAIYLAHVGCSLTYTEAGALYGRNRTTAAHACRVVEQRRDDGQFDRILELLEACMRLSVVQAHPVMAAHVSNYGNQGIDRRQPHRGNDV